MKFVVVGLGVQGKKRLACAKEDVTAIVDPISPEASHKNLTEVPLSNYDAAFVCTPNGEKTKILRYLLENKKHVLVEKPFASKDLDELDELRNTAQERGVACYTAYNLRFEPQIQNLKSLLDRGEIGNPYLANFYYGNGTAMDVKKSAWRDSGSGVLEDLGSHMLDLTSFLFDVQPKSFQLWNANRFENKAFDHVLFGSTEASPKLQMEGALVSWKNTFRIDVLGERGSAHVDGLLKWGPSTLTHRKRIFPSGRPEETVQTLNDPDQSWNRELEHFKQLCSKKENTLEKDRWIFQTLKSLAL